MERKIRRLPEELTLKIAAGEVIERPASILKELLENAVDAGATAIRIELSKGGCGAIRIEDNGSGIPADEAPLAFERFATSKIDTFEDLYSVSSFGFRGEALPSIAAIARVELTTRTKKDLSGTRVVIQAGRIAEVTSVGCPVGTSIAVTQIFENVPVRKKFLKSEATEQGYCLDTLHCAALACPQVRIEARANGRALFSIPATTRQEERVTLVLGQETGEQLLAVSGAGEDGLRLQGFVSRPGWSRSSARHLYCFVNRRHVKDPLINHALMTAYRNTLEARRYPVAVLHIDCPPGFVDVNCHPAKMEVRFQNPREVYGLVVESALSVLSGLPAGQPTVSQTRQGNLPAAAYEDRIREALKRYHLHTGAAKLTFSSPQSPTRPPEQPSLEVQPPEANPKPPTPVHSIVFSELTYLGPAGGPYLVFTGPDGLVLVDQHAAHERILFEKLREKSDRSGVGQHLLMPEVLTLTPGECKTILACLPLLDDMGLHLEPFGENTIIVKTIPALLPDLDPAGLIRDLLDQADTDTPTRLDTKKDHLLAVMACRGAVKAHHDLSPAEAGALCREMDRTPFAATCPHGRPTYVLISKRDLERMFKRQS